VGCPSSRQTADKLVLHAAYGKCRDVLNELRRPCAYVNCVETTRTRTMLATILQQLKVRTARGYRSCPFCSHADVSAC